MVVDGVRFLFVLNGMYRWHQQKINGWSIA
jgi:hypothetical protein